MNKAYTRKLNNNFASFLFPKLKSKIDAKRVKKYRYQAIKQKEQSKLEEYIRCMNYIRYGHIHNREIMKISSNTLNYESISVKEMINIECLC